jgi:hypothetical protein
MSRASLVSKSSSRKRVSSAAAEPLTNQLASGVLGPLNSLRILWLISLVAFGLARSAGIHTMTSAQVVPHARANGAGNDHGRNQQKEPPSLQHFVSNNSACVVTFRSNVSLFISLPLARVRHGDGISCELPGRVILFAAKPPTLTKNSSKRRMTRTWRPISTAYVFFERHRVCGRQEEQPKLHRMLDARRQITRASKIILNYFNR